MTEYTPHKKHFLWGLTFLLAAFLLPACSSGGGTGTDSGVDADGDASKSDDDNPLDAGEEPNLADADGGSEEPSLDDGDGGNPSDLDVPDGGNGGDQTVDGGGDEETDGGDSNPVCVPTGSFLASINGSVLDDQSAPIFDARLIACLLVNDGRILCLRSVGSLADGSFTIEIPESARCVVHAAIRVIGIDPNSATSYILIDLAASDPNLNLTEPIIIFGTQAPAVLPQGTPDQTLTVEFDPWLSLDVVQNELDANYAELRSRRLAGNDPLLSFARVPPTVNWVYAFNPEGEITTGFTAHITTDQEMDQLVEVYVLGGIFCHLADGMAVPEAEWHMVDTATVGVDGSIDVSIPCLNWLAYGLVQ